MGVDGVSRFYTFKLELQWVRFLRILVFDDFALFQVTVCYLDSLLLPEETFGILLTYLPTEDIGTLCLTSQVVRYLPIGHFILSDPNESRMSSMNLLV